MTTTEPNRRPDPTAAGAPTGDSKRPFRGAFVVLALVALLGVGFLAARSYFGQPIAGALEPAAAPDLGGPFILVDQDGRTVTDQTFRGQYMLVYFGFTYCPDVCPTSLSRNAQALELLGSKAEKIVPILISIDPERDTPAKMKEYVAAFDPRLIGLTGTVEQVKAAAQAYKVFYMKAPQPGGDPNAYVVDHSTFTYLMGPDGRLLRFYRHGQSPEEIATDLKAVIR
ncbi:MAG: SCO family protein [Rhodospirillales bacterium]